MIGLLRCFIQAEHTWTTKVPPSLLNQMLYYFAATVHSLYLKSVSVYLESMRELEMKHPEVQEAFINGYHVVRRSKENLSGLSTNFTIELNKSVKLTRGRRTGENLIALWIMSMSSSARTSLNSLYICLIGTLLRALKILGMHTEVKLIIPESHILLSCQIS